MATQRLFAKDLVQVRVPNTPAALKLLFRPSKISGNPDRNCTVTFRKHLQAGPLMTTFQQYYSSRRPEGPPYDGIGYLLNSYDGTEFRKAPEGTSLDHALVVFA